MARYTSLRAHCALVSLLALACARDNSTPAGQSAAAENRPTPLAGPSGTVLDDFGDTVPVGKPASRIVSLTPATTEILFAIGAGAKLVGRGEYDHWPAAALRIPAVSPGLRPNVEAVLATSPDLVLLYASQDNRAAAQRFRAAGIATAAFKVDSIEQFARLTRLLGRLTGDSASAVTVADTVLRTIDSVRARTASLPRVSVVMPTWDQPLIVIGGGSFMSQLVNAAGGRNIYDSMPSPSPTVAFEDVVRRNPDAVLVGPERGAIVRTSPRWRALPSVRRGRVLILDTALTLRPAVRLGEGAVSLAKLLHPELTK